MSVKITRQAQKRYLGKAEGAFWGLCLLRSLFSPVLVGNGDFLKQVLTRGWMLKKAERSWVVGVLLAWWGCGCTRDAAVPGMWCAEEQFWG